jgi:hypothetical protein
MDFYIVIPGNTPWETIEQILHQEIKSINFANLFAAPAPFAGADKRRHRPVLPELKPVVWRQLFAYE